MTKFNFKSLTRMYVCTKALIGFWFLASWFLLSGCAVDENAPIKEFLYKEGIRQYAQEHYPQALEHFSQFLSFEKDNLEVLVLAGISATETGLITYTQADELIKKNLGDLAQRHINEGNEQHTLAFELFKYAIAKFPSEPQPYYGLGTYYYLRSTNPLPVPYQIDSEERKKEKENAIHLFRRSLELDPDGFLTFKYLGLLLIEQEDIESKKEGIAFLIKYLDKRKLDQKSWEEFKPRNRLEESDKEIALDIIKRDITKITDLMLAESLDYSEEMLKKQSYDQIIEFLLNMEKHDYTGYTIKTELAISYYMKGSTTDSLPLISKAVALLEDAQKADQDYSKALKYLGLSYRLLGQAVLAKEQLEKYLVVLDVLISRAKYALTDEDKKHLQELIEERDKMKQLLDQL